MISMKDEVNLKLAQNRKTSVCIQRYQKSFNKLTIATNFTHILHLGRQKKPTIRFRVFKDRGGAKCTVVVWCSITQGNTNNQSYDNESSNYIYELSKPYQISNPNHTPRQLQLLVPLLNKTTPRPCMHDGHFHVGASFFRQ